MLLHAESTLKWKEPIFQNIFNADLKLQYIIIFFVKCVTGLWQNLYTDNLDN